MIKIVNELEKKHISNEIPLFLKSGVLAKIYAEPTQEGELWKKIENLQKQPWLT
ncbi:hypothetical protein DB41_JC00050 [Neochlamydia sp. TUME1]|uniref:hypothetical protein n=1 Tax=Neochlamydia sp. TUME1 TaxID=1478174 RepID=UPI0005826438|nr:hypothetical protein [Neochlamydia sp. TUME1]KIC73666.1 hypothetical protein DB41_JC00050 [Neochlamydia sp. TUME1]